MDIILKNVMPLIPGAVFSFICWLLVKILFSPRLEISKHISKKETVDGQLAYRIKIRNCGFRRCSEIMVYAKIEVRKLEGQQPFSFDTFFINTSFNGYYPVVDRGKSMILHLYNTVQNYDEKYYHPDFIKKINEATAVEDLLKLSEDTKLILYVIANDDFSGIRKIYVSKEYRYNNIQKRNFIRNSVELYKEEDIIK